MEKILKIAIVGLGAIGKEHIKAAASSKNCVISAVCDINEEEAKRQAEALGVPYFTDYKEIPEKTDADAVILNLPHWLHCESAVFFLEKGLHVLVEKPMANSVVECEKMIQAAEKSGKKLAVGHVQRYSLGNRKVKQLAQSGELGPFLMFSERRTIDYFYRRPAWFLDKKQAGGGIIMNYGAHALDKLFYLTGERDAEVFASYGNQKAGIDVEGHAQILLRFPSGVSGTVTFDGYAFSGYDTVYYFQNGAVKVEGDKTSLRQNNTDWQIILGQEDSLMLYRQLQEFCKYVWEEPSEITDGAYGKAIINILEKIYRQA